LRGQKVEAPSGPSSGGAGGGKSGGEAAAVNAGSVFGVTLGSIAAAGVAGAVKAAKLAEASRDETEKLAQQIINKLKEASAQVGGDEGKAIQKELEDAYKESAEHVRKIEAAAKDLAKRKTDDAVKTLQKRAEESVPGFKSMEQLVGQGTKWLEEKAPGFVQDAKDRAKQITTEMANRKQEVDKWYKDATDKLKKTAEDEWDDDGKKIKDELEKAYKQSTQQIKKVVEDSRKTVEKATDSAVDTLKKTAEMTSPVFNAVENLAKKALDWWESD
jgi:vacuolar-type H+-ATPase subunit H